MNPEIKEKWVKALRSGEYKQGKGQLLRDGKFCCLGVLEDLRKKEQGEEWGDDGDYGLPSSNTVIWAEFHTKSPVVAGNFLTTYNDAFDKTFPEIADLIEEHL